MNDDMTSFDPARVRTITPSGYNEAAFVFKRAGVYYFMWSENDTRSADYRVTYATGSFPLGPWTRRGVVLQKRLDAGIKGTGHHFVVRAPGTDTWYVAYHRFAIPAAEGGRRGADRLLSDGPMYARLGVGHLNRWFITDYDFPQTVVRDHC